MIFLTTQLSAVVYQEPTSQFKPLFEFTAVYIENDSKILLLHRQEDKAQGSKWRIPSGKLNTDETALQTAIREVKEKTRF